MAEEKEELKYKSLKHKAFCEFVEVEDQETIDEIEKNKDGSITYEYDDFIYKVLTEDEVEELLNEKVESYYNENILGSLPEWILDSSRYFNKNGWEEWKLDQLKEDVGGEIAEYDGEENEVRVFWDGANQNIYIYKIDKK